MAELHDGYAIPSRICWVDGSTTAASKSVTSGDRKSVGKSGGSFKICWTCRHYTYQLQYRIRRRYSPAHAVLLDLPEGGEFWEDWGEWQGNGLSDDVKSATERLPWGDLNVTALPFEFPYDFSHYDRIEYQVRIRTFDEPSTTCSEWGYGELAVIYEPEVKIISNALQPNGDVELSVDTNWSRGGNRFSLTNLRRDDQLAKPVDGYVKLVNVEPDFKATIPASMVGDAKTVYATMRFYTSDGNDGGEFDKQWFEVNGHQDDEDIAEPVVTVDDAESCVIITVDDERYENVMMSAEWTDSYNVRHMEELIVESFTGIDTPSGWMGKLIAPPFGVSVTYRISVVSGSGWRSATVEHETANRRSISLFAIRADRVVELRHKISWSSNMVPDIEAVKCAGKTNPVARFGKGGVRALSAQGSMVSPGMGVKSDWLEQIELLRSHRGEWIYRNPVGERIKVAITSVSDERDFHGAMKVSISMTEVE